MRTLAFFLLLALCIQGAFSQTDSETEFIFIPHPRSDNRQQQSVLPAIEKIDFSKYSMILLGGDLTWYTSINRKSMEYIDSLFDLGSPNTLWTMGNHDLDHPDLIKEFTGRERFYSYYRDGITFVILDTEADASGFQSSLISGNQLEMIRSVADTIEISTCLVVLHHRLLWMIGNSDFATRLDSVGESTKQLDTTNFYQEVFPLLQKVKGKGIKVLCLGGDKSKINIEYSPEDSITFLTSTMDPAFADSINDVLILTYDKNLKKIAWDFVPLDKLEKNQQNALPGNPLYDKAGILRVWQTHGSNEITLEVCDRVFQNMRVNIYSITGELNQSVSLDTNQKKTFMIKRKGIYIIKAVYGNSVITRKISLI